jgi:hypothetical protein
VVHNAPAGVWKTGVNIATAIKDIEDSNIDLGIEFSIANLCWLNSDQSRAITGSGPLMISFKNHESANMAIDFNLAIKGMTCTVALYIPRPPQCFRCQGWGH